MYLEDRTLRYGGYYCIRSLGRHVVYIIKQNLAVLDYNAHDKIHEWIWLLAIQMNK
jgi:hypothetical protein